MPCASLAGRAERADRVERALAPSVRHRPGATVVSVAVFTWAAGFGVPASVCAPNRGGQADLCGRCVGRADRRCRCGMYVYDQGRRDVIASGVRVGGVDLGGLKVAAARQRLSTRLAASLNRPETVTYHARKFTLTGRQVGLSVDVNGLVQQALRPSRSGSFVSRTFRERLRQRRPAGRLQLRAPVRPRVRSSRPRGDRSARP